jgi:hypothetical protein
VQHPDEVLAGRSHHLVDTVAVANVKDVKRSGVGFSSCSLGIRRGGNPLKVTVAKSSLRQHTIIEQIGLRDGRLGS